jgi:hypothetical protein
VWADFAEIGLLFHVPTRPNPSDATFADQTERLCQSPDFGEVGLQLSEFGPLGESVLSV